MSEGALAIEIEDPAGWIQAVMVVLLAALAWFRPLGWKRQLSASGLAAIAIGALLLAYWSSRWLGPLAAAVVRDWLPVPLMLFPYWQAGQFFMGADPVAEKRLANFDHVFFRAISMSPAKTSISPALGVYLELAYLLVYPLMPLGLATLYVTNSRQFVHYYWIVVLLATYVCFAITPFVPAMPPRALESYEKFRMPPSKLGAFNRFILRRGSIQAITFPSAHVASAMAAGLVLLRVEPCAGLIFLLIVAIVVFAATFPALKTG